MAYKKFVEGAALGAGLAAGFIAVVFVVNTFAPALNPMKTGFFR